MTSAPGRLACWLAVTLAACLSAGYWLARAGR